MSARIIRVHTAKGVVYARIMEPMYLPGHDEATYAVIDMIDVPEGLDQTGAVEHFRSQGWMVQEDVGTSFANPEWVGDDKRLFRVDFTADGEPETVLISAVNLQEAIINAHGVLTYRFDDIDTVVSDISVVEWEGDPGEFDHIHDDVYALEAVMAEVQAKVAAKMRGRYGLGKPTSGGRGPRERR